MPELDLKLIHAIAYEIMETVRKEAGKYNDQLNTLPLLVSHIIGATTVAATSLLANCASKMTDESGDRAGKDFITNFTILFNEMRNNDKDTLQ